MMFQDGDAGSEVGSGRDGENEAVGVSGAGWRAVVTDRRIYRVAVDPYFSCLF